MKREIKLYVVRANGNYSIFAERLLRSTLVLKYKLWVLLKALFLLFNMCENYDMPFKSTPKSQYATSPHKNKACSHSISISWFEYTNWYSLMIPIVLVCICIPNSQISSDVYCVVFTSCLWELRWQKHCSFLTIK